MTRSSFNADRVPFTMSDFRQRATDIANELKRDPLLASEIRNRFVSDEALSETLNLSVNLRDLRQAAESLREKASSLTSKVSNLSSAIEDLTEFVDGEFDL